MAYNRNHEIDRNLGALPQILELKDVPLNFAISRLFANNFRTEQDVISRKSALKTTDSLLHEGDGVILGILVH